ncbi:MAG: hypothetical protein US11_C0006G0015 [Candidatus Roizmanbacteria bacterium GW2011_GWA2_36_23]|uniref:Endonuclease/exonuclease/phosphatase domain-containing protein n=1 Tax=Candidatus Roizmanbacteria bacterium GW2011_GWA2_36_23 TaxID=1618480 RepID=A0A0G0E3T7_9BACT|nr:MAG: hypothetical protein US11_C0006G0015 [Candidatus Roizmanbacteria bacterium GW2011_GWA2_36_23]
MLVLYNIGMKFSLLTYNVLYNQAFQQLPKLIKNHKPDVVCLQEIDTKTQNLMLLENHGYRLADYSNSFFKFGTIYGIATFYNNKTLSLTNSNALILPRSIYELFLTVLRFLRGGNKPRTLLQTDFIMKNNKKKISVYNTHLTTICANGVRIKQIKEALDLNRINHQKNAAIITGDFNYFPYGRKQLEEIMEKYQFAEATKKIAYTIQFSSDGQFNTYHFIQKLVAKVFSKLFTDKLKIDYIYYKKLKHIETKRVDIRFSDHYPIIAYFSG